MTLNRRLTRRLALALIAFLAFAQASVALSACSMERGTMSQMEMAGPDDACCDAPELKATPLTSGCVLHCTADLQLPGEQLALVRGPADLPVLILPETLRISPPRASPEAQRTIPPRILLHSFQI